MRVLASYLFTPVSCVLSVATGNYQSSVRDGGATKQWSEMELAQLDSGAELWEALQCARDPEMFEVSGPPPCS